MVAEYDEEGLQMRSSGRDAQGGAMATPAIISRERRPTKGNRESTAHSKKDSFDVHSFLNFSGGARKLVDFQKNEIIFATGDLAGNVLYIEKGMVRLSVTSGRGKLCCQTS